MSEAPIIEILFFVYFAVFAACVVGIWLFFRKRDPVFRWRWHARVSLFVGVVIGGFLVVMMGLMSQSWVIAVASLACVSLIAFFNVTRTTTCHSCGKTAPPQSLVAAAKYCVRCGGPVAPSPVFGAAEAVPPSVGEATARSVAAVEGTKAPGR